MEFSYNKLFRFSSQLMTPDHVKKITMFRIIFNRILSGHSLLIPQFILPAFRRKIYFLVAGEIINSKYIFIHYTSYGCDMGDGNAALFMQIQH